MATISTSKPLYVYLQRPDTGEWVTVGRYRQDAQAMQGWFRYAPSYAQAGLAWSIDPVNLPFNPEIEFPAPRYRGLHDVLRDASPDAWGRLLIQREHGLAEGAHDARYLTLSGNADRWGALAVGSSRTPAIARLNSPRLAQLDTLVMELLAIAERRPPVDATLRRRLLATTSLGGARPKATVQDGHDYWLVKPWLPTDVEDIAQLEHFAQSLGSACGLNFARTHYHRLSESVAAVRVRRFDRQGPQRLMALSGASLLEAEYPGASVDRWSYPRLAEQLRRIGAPREDTIELFGRMVLNAVLGNDDDHPRNHAVIFNPQERRWRLAPAFDVVPHPELTPATLTMQLSLGRREISPQAVLDDAIRFGFSDCEEARMHLHALLAAIEPAFEDTAQLLNPPMRARLRERVRTAVRAFKGDGGA